MRNNRRKYASILEDYDFIRYSSALKIALPQDDYDCPYFLDEWLTNWNVNIIFSVLHEHRNLFYKKFINSKKGKIYEGYTSYINDELINLWEKPKQIKNRKIDISYRTHDKGKFLCSVRYQKYNLANIFQESLGESSTLKVDISNRHSQMIKGDKWYKFLENSKFCLASPSGSSAIDVTGHNRYLINEACKNNPNITFKEVKSSFLTNIDYYNFTALSPRNIESILSNTVQIAIRGNYSGVLIPYLHFIPLNKDCSNLDEVIEMTNDIEFVEKMAKNARESVFSNEKLRSKYLLKK